MLRTVHVQRLRVNSCRPVRVYVRFVRSYCLYDRVFLKCTLYSSRAERTEVDGRKGPLFMYSMYRNILQSLYLPTDVDTLHLLLYTYVVEQVQGSH